jgi:hypothetical protein
LPPAAPPPPKPAAKRTTVELLAEAEARVGDGERIIARQRDLIFDLRRKGLSSEEAEKLLRSFQNLQHEHEKHLVTLRIRARRGT